MKYKRIYMLNNSGSDADFQGSFEFFTRSTAEASCQDWSAKGGAHLAWMWDGERWTFFS